MKAVKTFLFFLSLYILWLKRVLLYSLCDIFCLYTIVFIFKSFEYVFKGFEYMFRTFVYRLSLGNSFYVSNSF